MKKYYLRKKWIKWNLKDLSLLVLNTYGKIFLECANRAYLAIHIDFWILKLKHKYTKKSKLDTMKKVMQYVVFFLY